MSSSRARPDLGDITVWADRIRALVAEPQDEADRGADAPVTVSVFPEWNSIPAPHLGRLSATPIRDAYFGEDPVTVSACLAALGREQPPPAVEAWIDALRSKPDYAEMLAELACARLYREVWSSAPYPPPI